MDNLNPAVPSILFSFLFSLFYWSFPHVIASGHDNNDLLLCDYCPVSFLFFTRVASPTVYHFQHIVFSEYSLDF